MLQWLDKLIFYSDFVFHFRLHTYGQQRSEESHVPQHAGDLKAATKRTLSNKGSEIAYQVFRDS